MTGTAQIILLLGVGLITVGSFILGFTLGGLPKRGRHKGRHAKGRGRHAR